MQTEYSHGKRWLYWVALPINVVAIAMSISLACDVSQNGAIVLSILAFCSQVAIFIIKEFVAAPFLGRAEEIRRSAMLQDGLGHSPTPVTLAWLQESLGNRKNHEPPFIGEYYTSSEKIGARRLLDITSESAFYTAANARRLWKSLIWVSGFGILILVITLCVYLFVLSNQVPATPASQTVEAWALPFANVSLIVFAVFGMGQLMTAALSFKSLAEKAEKITNQCESVLSVPDTKGQATEALIAFSEYNCAICKALPIPSKIYKRHQKVVDSAWGLRRSKISPSA